MTERGDDIRLPVHHSVSVMTILEFNDWRRVANESVGQHHKLATALEDNRRRMIAIHVGAGPALDRQGWELQNVDGSKAAIFCVDAAWSWFVKRDIAEIVDYVVVKEEGDAGAGFFGAMPMGFGSDAPGAVKLLCPNTIHPAVRDAWVLNVNGAVHQYVNWQDRPTVRDRWGDVVPNTTIPWLEPVVENVLWHSIEAANYLGFVRHVIVGADFRIDGTTHHSDIAVKPESAEVLANYFASQIQQLRTATEQSQWADYFGTITDCSEGALGQIVKSDELRPTLEHLGVYRA